jgi:hypothetical protein
LADALIRLNSPSSPAWTTKCDVWPVNAVDSDAFDSDELDADPQCATSALACYIDLIPAETPASSTIDVIVDWCKQLCIVLHNRALRQCRLDAIVRRTFSTADAAGLGVTAYLTACGSSPKEASAVLERALAALADSVLAIGDAGRQASKYKRNITGE